MLASMPSHRDCPSLLMEVTNDTVMLENCMPVLFIKLNIYLVPLLGFYQHESKTSHRNLYVNIYSTFIYNYKSILQIVTASTNCSIFIQWNTIQL